jgi:hypothetical protein
VQVLLRSALKHWEGGPVFLNLHDLNPQEKTFVLSTAQKDLKKFGVQKASIKSVSGVKSNEKYVFFIETTKGTIVGTYKDGLLDMALVVDSTSDQITVETLENGQVHYEYYNTTAINNLKQIADKVVMYQLTNYGSETVLREPNGISRGFIPQWHWEHHWWGWKLTLNEHETQELLDFMGLGIAGGGTKVGRAALISFLERLGITIAKSILEGIAEVLILAGAYIKVVDDMGGNKGIFIERILEGPTIIWHN